MVCDEIEKRLSEGCGPRRLAAIKMVDHSLLLCVFMLKMVWVSFIHKCVPYVATMHFMLTACLLAHCTFVSCVKGYCSTHLWCVHTIQVY